MSFKDYSERSADDRSMRNWVRSGNYTFLCISVIWSFFPEGTNDQTRLDRASDTLPVMFCRLVVGPWQGT